MNNKKKGAFKAPFYYRSFCYAKSLFPGDLLLLLLQFCKEFDVSSHIDNEGQDHQCAGNTNQTFYDFIGNLRDRDQRKHDAV